MARDRLPHRRYSESFDVEFPRYSGKRYAVTFGIYPDGRCGEVFIASYQKVGSDADTAARDLAVLISIGLQHGASLGTLADATIKTADGDPEGFGGIVLAALRARFDERAGA